MSKRKYPNTIRITLDIPEDLVESKNGNDFLADVLFKNGYVDELRSRFAMGRLRTLQEIRSEEEHCSKIYELLSGNLFYKWLDEHLDDAAQTAHKEEE